MIREVFRQLGDQMRSNHDQVLRAVHEAREGMASDLQRHEDRELAKQDETAVKLDELGGRLGVLEGWKAKAVGAVAVLAVVVSGLEVVRWLVG